MKIGNKVKFLNKVDWRIEMGKEYIIVGMVNQTISGILKLRYLCRTSKSSRIEILCDEKDIVLV